MTQRTWKAWGELEEREAVQMREDGMTTAEIAAHLGRTVTSVSRRFDLLGVKAPRLRREMWRGIFKRRHRDPQVAAELGLTLGAVKKAKQRLRQAGIKITTAAPRGRPRSPTEAPRK